MKKWIYIIALFFSYDVNATLVARDLDGDLTTVEAYYDDLTNLTWLADANYAMSSGYDDDGLMTWSDAMRWVNIDLNINQYGGTDRWRLPYTPISDDDCTDWTTADTCYQGEMAMLYYGSMGNTSYGPSVASPFENLQDLYWSSNAFSSITIGSSTTSMVKTFNMNYGSYRTSLESELHYAIAVYDGDLGVAAVPLPAAMWLFLTGLITLSGIVRFGHTRS